MGILVSTPDIRKLNEYFILKDKVIYFGLTDIKGVGKSVFNKLKDLVGDQNIEDMSWLEILLNILLNINSTAVKGLISSGALDHYKKTRNQMLFEYSAVSELTKKEIELCKKYLSEKKLKSILEKLGQDKINIRRKNVVANTIKSLDNPPYSLEDSIEWISDKEYELLGYSISCSRIDMYDITNTNCTCGDFLKNAQQDVIIAGEVEQVNVVKTKSGKNKGAEMAFLSISDNTGVLDSVIVFPEAYMVYQNVLFDSNIIIVKGSRSKEKDSLIVEKIFVPQS